MYIRKLAHKWFRHSGELMGFCFKTQWGQWGPYGGGGGIVLIITLRKARRAFFAKYIGQYRLLLCKIVDFCKVYWSPRFVTLQNRRFLQSILVTTVCLSVCLSVCLFVCLSVCLSVIARCTGHTTGPIFLKIWQLMYSVPRTLAIFFGENRIKIKVKVTTFVKIALWAITFEPEVGETSGWLENVPYRIPLLQDSLSFDVRRHLCTSRDFKKISENHIMGHNFWTGSDRDFWLFA